MSKHIFPPLSTMAAVAGHLWRTLNSPRREWSSSSESKRDEAFNQNQYEVSRYLEHIYLPREGHH